MGLIPAYAGRTTELDGETIIAGAHPRLRGADFAFLFAPNCALGSSPLTRGGLAANTPSQPALGLIPAYAGRTDLRRPGLDRGRAHPRLRGADWRSNLAALNLRGSSPLTRGGLPRAWTPDGQPGLIPAYAGRTINPPNLKTSTRAHPRLRGADASSTHAPRHPKGSSPLTRGGPFVAELKQDPSGLIPAYAGRTPQCHIGLGICWAHPRLRGADLIFAAVQDGIVGSSPLTRGGLVVSYDDPDPWRLIPAYAGRTDVLLLWCTAHAAHPRLRGADKSQSLSWVSSAGSSPLTRGGPADVLEGVPMSGLIPAYAGRTG
ncbi:Domain of uncharacterised function (DUF2825) [Corynebacterium striatum]|nr:Domain of uncharacterised function (DUF2825) [Corynebacterium striatum]